MPNLRALKLKQYEKPNLQKQFLIGLDYANNKLGQVLGSTPSTQVSTSKHSTQRRSNAIDIFGIGKQAVQRNKRQVANFLYNKSKLVRDLIMQN